MEPEELKQILADYVETARNPKYKGDFNVINSKFPEFKNYDKQVLADYVATANNPKYKGNFDLINSKFPEFFDVKKKAVSQPGGKTSAPGLSSVQVTKQVIQKTKDLLAPPPARSVNPNAKKMFQGRSNKETVKILQENIKSGNFKFKPASFQEAYNVDPGQYVQAVQQAKQNYLETNGEDEGNYYEDGQVYPKQDYLKYENIIIKRNKDGSPMAYINSFNKSFSDFFLKTTSGALQAVRDVTGMEKDVAWNPLNATIDLLNDASGVYDYYEAKSGLKDTGAQGIAKGTFHILPVIATLVATEGASAATMGARTAAAGGDLMMEYSVPKMVTNTITKAINTPLTRVLTYQPMAQTYGEQKAMGRTGTEALGKSIVAGTEGFKSAGLLALQMGVAGRVTNEYMQGLAMKSLTPTNAGYAQKLVNGLNTSLVFGATPIVNDLVKGERVDIDKAIFEGAMGLTFELPGVVSAVGGIAAQPIKRRILNNSIFEAAAPLNGKQVGELTNLTLNNNAISNFFNAKDQAIDLANGVNATHQQLFEASLRSGEKAYDAKDMAEKNTRHAEQLTYQKASDIKYVTEAVIKDKEAFVEAIDKMDLPKDVKDAYRQRVEDVYSKYSEEGRVNTRFDEIITSLSDDLVNLESQLNEAATPSKKAEITAKIKSKQAELAEVQKSLDTFSELTLTAREEKKATTFNQIKVNSFVEKIKTGEKLETPEDIQFYENNKKEIEAKLKEDAAQEAEATGEVAKAIKPEDRAELKDVKSTSDFIRSNDLASDISQKVDQFFIAKEGKDINDTISEEYHRAKLDGSNPELVRVVEESLPEAPKEFISEEVSRLRAEEQAEYDALDNPNDAVKRKEIYDRYDEPITEAIREAKKEAKPEVLEVDKIEMPELKDDSLDNAVEDLTNISDLEADMNRTSSKSRKSKLKEKIDQESANIDITSPEGIIAKGVNDSYESIKKQLKEKGLLKTKC